MNVIRNYNDENIGCALLEFQLASMHSMTDFYEANIISASLAWATEGGARSPCILKLSEKRLFS